MCIGYSYEEYINKSFEKLDNLDDKMSYVSNTEKIEYSIKGCIESMLSYTCGHTKSLNRKFLLKLATRIWGYFDEDIFEIKKSLNKMNKEELIYILNTMCWWLCGTY